MDQDAIFKMNGTLIFVHNNVHMYIKSNSLFLSYTVEGFPFFVPDHYYLINKLFCFDNTFYLNTKHSLMLTIDHQYETPSEN